MLQISAFCRSDSFANKTRQRSQSSRGASISMWLVCQITWQPVNAADADPDSKVDVSFNFAPLQNQFQPFPDPPPIDAMRALMLDAASAQAITPAAQVRSTGEVELGAPDDPQRAAAELRIGVGTAARGFMAPTLSRYST